jgi:prophage antirepressor-like protein
MDTNTTTERRGGQLTPFYFGDHAVRTALVNGEPSFVARDACEALGIQEPARFLRGFPKSELGLFRMYAFGDRQYLITVNEPGLYRLIFRSRSPAAETFKTWVYAEVLPRVRRRGGALSRIRAGGRHE